MPTATSHLLARDIMAKKLILLRPEMDIHEAVGILLKNKISGAPVVDEFGKYLGVFSERSSIKLILEAFYEGSPTHEIRTYINGDAETVFDDHDVLAVMRAFQQTTYRRLPVLNRKEELVGQISRRDVLKALHSSLAPKKASESGILYFSGIHAREESPFV